MDERLDAVIVAYDSADELPSCLRALRQVRELDRIYVVEHGAPSLDDATARAFGVEIVAGDGNPGFGAGQNRGAAASHARYLLLVNPDAEIVATSIPGALQELREHDDVAMVQGVVVNRSTRAPERSQGREIRPIHLFGRALSARALLGSPWVRRVAATSPVLRDHVEREPTAPREVEWLAATAPLVRKAAFDEVGGFAPGYFMYGEDLDLCRRLRVAGWRLLAHPSRWATHGGGASTREPIARELQWWRGTLRFCAHWWSTTDFAAALAAAGLQALRLSLRAPGRGRAIFAALLGDAVRARREGHP